jgi:hypothetical protein
MGSSFPANLDSFTNPTGSDPMNTPSVDHGDQHTNENDSIEALEAKVGIDNAGFASPQTQDFQVRNNLISTQLSSARVDAVLTNQKKFETDTNRFMLGDGSLYKRDIFAPGGSGPSASSEMLYGYVPGIVVSSTVYQPLTVSSGVIDNVGWGTGSSFSTLTVPSAMEGLWSIGYLGRTARSKALSIRQFVEFIHTSFGVPRYYRTIFGLETSTNLRVVIPLIAGDTITFGAYVAGDTDFYDYFLWMNRLGL